MSREFVVLDESDQEIDWIDPVSEFTAADGEWIVHTGAHEYRVTRSPGLRYVIREREER